LRLGLKAAEQILKKSPDHGDTLAMKALILNSQGKSEEAFALAKVALMKDMKSHVCWHVYGLLWRAAKNFDEAIRAYKMALKLEPESQQILRDLALLQAQMRDFQGYIESRRVMLQARPGWRQNWTALAVANHLAGNLAEAENILTKYEESIKQQPRRTDTEHSEAVLYKNTIIAEQGDYERALEHLKTSAKGNPDRTAVMELKADYLLKLERSADAEAAYRALIARNSDNSSYYEGLERAVNIDRSTKEAHKKLAELYKTFGEQYPRADAPRRLPLSFLEGT
jgi:predicted Zn-dependent protease